MKSWKTICLGLIVLTMLSAWGSIAEAARRDAVRRGDRRPSARRHVRRQRRPQARPQVRRQELGVRRNGVRRRDRVRRQDGRRVIQSNRHRRRRYDTRHQQGRRRYYARNRYPRSDYRRHRRHKYYRRHYPYRPWRDYRDYRWWPRDWDLSVNVYPREKVYYYEYPSAPVTVYRDPPVRYEPTGTYYDDNAFQPERRPLRAEESPRWARWDAAAAGIYSKPLETTTYYSDIEIVVE